VRTTSTVQEEEALVLHDEEAEPGVIEAVSEI